MIFSRLFFQLTRKSGLLNSALQCPDMPQLAINVAMPRLVFSEKKNCVRLTRLDPTSKSGRTVGEK